MHLDQISIDGPKVSVVIPTHNDLDVLPRAIESVLTQSHRNLEIIVVDDAGEQDAQKLVSPKYQSDRRIHFYRQPTKKLCGGARNSGVDLSTGDFVFFLDADDKLLPDAIERLTAVAVARNADIVQGGTVRGDVDGRLELYHAEDFVSEGGINGLEHFAANRFASIAWNKLYRRAFLAMSGIRFVEGYMHEDVPFSGEAAYLATNIASIRIPVIHYVENTNSLTRRLPKRLNIESYLATYLSLLKIVTRFGLIETHQELALKILHTHGSADFGPKLIDCHRKMGRESFEKELLSVAKEQFGGDGLAVGDLIIFFLEHINARDAARVSRPLHRATQSAMSTMKRALSWRDKFQ